MRHVLPGSPPPQPLEGGETQWELPLPLTGGSGGGGGGPAAAPDVNLEVLGDAALALWGLTALLVLATIAVYALSAFIPGRARGGAVPATPLSAGAPLGEERWAPYPIPGDLLELRARLRRAVEALGLPRGATGMEAARASGDKGLMEAARVYYERLFGGSRGGS